jgi:2-methylcitrate dehydratase PrpD
LAIVSSFGLGGEGAVGWTEEFVDRLLSVSVDAVEDSVLVSARCALVDLAGAGVYGSTRPWSRIVAEHALARGARDGAVPLFGRPERRQASLAALVNGTAAHSFELDDVHPPTLTHCGAVVIPAALAVAVDRGVEGGRFLAAVIAGYEAMGRLGLAAVAQPTPFHTTGTHGTLAAAIAASVCAGLDRAATVNALGIAASFTSGIKAFQTGGGEVKRMHPGRSAEGGLIAVELTEAGLTGPTDVLENFRGYLAAYGGPRQNPPRLTDNWGQRYIIEDSYYKPYTTCGANHAAIECVRSILAEHPLDPDDITAVQVGTSRRGVTENSNIALTNTMSVQYSVEAAIALTILGTVEHPDSFDLDTYQHSAAPAIADRVTAVVHDDIDATYPGQMGARVTIGLRDGRTLTHHEPGLRTDQDPHTQLTAATRKFTTLTTDLLTPSQQQAALHTIDHLTTTATPTDLAHHLTTP